MMPHSSSNLPAVCFNSHAGRSPLWRGTFHNPLETLAVFDLKEVGQLVDRAQAAAREGKWVVLMLTYEAAPAFDPAFRVHADHSDFPLAWMAVFDEYSELSPEPVPEPYSVGEWTPVVDRDAYVQAVDRIHRYIYNGDTYQVNYTFPMTADVQGDLFAWYHDLCMAQQADYCAFLDLGRFKVLSISPELFFEAEPGLIRTRPMKGTIGRGRWTEEDSEKAKLLARSTKDRAENVMIVDLLRNDLGRVCLAGSVKTARLFEIEKFRTVLQMTSTVEGRIASSTTLRDLFHAIFPCGSITGAPKIRTMEIINEVEPCPRGTYTGTIGLLAPNGQAVFNVAIRTVVVDSDTGRARFGVGGGITSDSTSAGEYEECRIKAAFLTSRAKDFKLLESLLLADGQYFLAERHLQRLADSAAYFGFRLDISRIRADLEIVRTSHQAKSWKVRLLVDRTGKTVTESQELAQEGCPVWPVGLAVMPVDSRDPFVFHKTTAREVYDNALKAAGPECRDVILWNERGEITESCYANVVVVRDGQKFTPPRTCGLLAGTFRAELLARGQIQERILTKDELLTADQVFLINSVRKWIRADCPRIARTGTNGGRKVYRR